MPFGSGLNTLSNFDWIGYSRVKWETCSNASGGDCLTPKGLTFMRAKIDDGVYVDVYNVHTDAGTEDEDLAARVANLEQVAAYIDTWSVGNAVLVYGDTNSRYTRAGDNITVFEKQNGLTDPWVELIHGGKAPTEETLCENPSTTDECETVDKVFYRGSPVVDLRATKWSYQSTRFLQSNGSILSDHNPISVDFAWTSGESLRQSGFWGGPHGAWFSDVPALSAASAPSAASEITFRGAERVDGVGLTLADGTALTHGGTGGEAASLKLEGGESWTSTKVCQDKKNEETRIFYIQATTSTGRTLEAGTSTEDCSTFTAPDGWGVVGFAGQDGDEIDLLAFLYAPL